MLRSAFKLLYLAMVPLGGWFAGAMGTLVKHPEVYAFFLIAGVAISLVGALGFADMERQEERDHQRALQAGRRPGRAEG